MNYFIAECYLHCRSECEISNGRFNAMPVKYSQITDNTFTYFRTRG